MAVTDLVIKVVADTASAQAGLADSEKATSKWAGGLNKAAGVAKVGLLAVGGVMVAGAKAAAEDAQAQAILATSLKNAAGATDQQVAATEDWITKTALATGVADDQLRPALGALVRATGDVGEAQKAAALAMDISTATGKDLQSVSEALGKAYGGNTASLGKLVPSIDKATLASGDMTAISAALASQVGGSTAAAADTAAGQFQIFGLALDETKEGIGAALLPALTALAGIMAEIASWAANNSTTMLVLIGAVSALAGIVIVVNAAVSAWAAIQAVASAATAVWTGAQWLLNAALNANPIGVTIILAIALAAAFVLVWKKSETFRKAVETLGRTAQTVFQQVVGFVGDLIAKLQDLISKVGDVMSKVGELPGKVQDAVATAKGWIGDLIAKWGDVIAKIGDVFAKIRDLPGEVNAAVGTAKGWIGDLIAKWGDVITKIGELFTKIGGLPGTIQSAVATAKGWIDDLLAPFQAVIDKVQALIDLISKIKIPHINLPGGKSAATATGYTTVHPGVARAPASAATGGGRTVINIHGAVDPEGTARQIRRILDGHDRRMGLRTA